MKRSGRGGTIEFGFNDKTFDKDMVDCFRMFEDECGIQSHACAGRVSGLLEHTRDRVIRPPSYDLRSIVNLLGKFGDAHMWLVTR